MRRMRLWLLRGFLVFLALLVLTAGGLYLWQRTSLPQTTGEVMVAGLTAPVEVLRNGDGVVTIRAENEADALFTLGYAHAQDRLFQMDFMRRLGAGRLSEVVGPVTLRLDRLYRTLGFYRVTEANLRQLSAESRAALDAYTAGVNAYMATHEGAWPLEFYLLGYEPEPWKPADSLVWGKLMALQLSGNYPQELLRARLLQEFPPAEVLQLFPSYPADGPVAAKDYAALEERGILTHLAQALPWEIGPKSASNAWALAPSRSASGGALLANDPHLALQEPGYWYLARIETPQRIWAGATAPGVPYMVIGHNGVLAWTFTTTHSDTQDLFLETLDGENHTHYVTAEGTRPFRTREETILVAGEEPVTITVRETYHGPVISDAVDEVEAAVPKGKVLALAWPALLEDDRSGEALFRLNRAAGVPQAIAALRDLHAPQQTLILADKEGRIALLAPGRVPIRKQGDGLAPVPGADGEFDWKGFIPYGELPRVVDPASGVLIAANNKLVDDDYPYLIAKEWYFPTRAQRIAEVLAGKPVWSLQEMAALQNDSLSIGARRLLPTLLAAVGDKPEAEAALVLLRGWDFVMDHKRPEPLIYSAWVQSLERRLLADELGTLFTEVATGNELRLEALLGPDSLFCDDRSTEPTETCEETIEAALDDALSELVELYGEDLTGWRWGKAHKAVFEHPILRFVPLAGGWAAYEVEADGGQDTVNRGGSPYAGPLPAAFRDRHGPGLRAVFDLADLDRSRFVIATGQSGNLLSPFYGNFVERWRDGATVELVGAKPETADRLVLKPQ